MRWSEPLPPPPGGWGRGTTIGVLLFLLIMSVICGAAALDGRVHM